MSDIVFNPILPPAWLAVALLSLALVLLWSGLRAVRSTRRKLLLSCLRMAALAALALMLLQPQRRSESISVVRPQLAVLVDNTRSMTEQVDPNQPTRSVKASQWMQAPSLASLRKDFDLRLFGFDPSLVEQTAFESLSFQGEETNILSALARVRERFRGQHLAAILLLSDGLDTAASSPESATASPEVPLFAFELERPFVPKKQPKRLSVTNVDFPPRVVTGWDTEVRVSILGHGMSGQTVTVELWRENEKAFETPVSFNEENQTRQIAFPITQTVPGTYHHEVRISDPVADRNARSNAFVIEAMQPGNRILYLQNTLGFDFKFLRKAILSDRNLQLMAFVRWADGRMVNMSNTEAALDLSPEALRETAVVILGDLDPAALSPEHCRNLRDFVDRGGGLVLMGGPHLLATGALSQTALGPLLPMQLPATYQEGSFPMKITDTGLHHPVFGSLFTAIEDFPPLLTFNGAQALSPNAEVLVETRVNGRAFPAVATLRYGKGRVMVLMSDTLWRWRLAAGSWARSPYDTFWAQLMDWLIPKEQQKQDGNRLELFSEKNQYTQGQSPEIRAILRNLTPVPDSIPLRLQTPDDKSFEYTMRPATFTGRDGKPVSGYRVAVEPNTTGVFKAKATLQDGAVEGETRFTVNAPAGELTGKPIDREFLRKLAEANGGAFYGMDQWDAWRKQLRINEIHTSKVELADLWNHSALLVFFLGTLTLEWAARKFWNLP